MLRGRIMEPQTQRVDQRMIEKLATMTSDSPICRSGSVMMLVETLTPHLARIFSRPVSPWSIDNLLTKQPPALSGTGRSFPVRLFRCVRGPATMSKLQSDGTG